LAEDPKPAGEADQNTGPEQRKLGWGKTMKVSLGVLGGVSLLMGYVSATGMKLSDRELGARKAIDDFFAALNRRDVDRVRSTLQFPHVRIAGNELTVWHDPSEFRIDFEHLAAEGWQYSTVDSCSLRLMSGNQAHFDVRHATRKSDGSRNRNYQSLWIMTWKDGRWGVQCRLLPMLPGSESDT
jgi:hypothetical protein